MHNPLFHPKTISNSLNRLFTTLTTILLLTNCGSLDEVSEDMVPEKVTEYTRNYIDKLATGKTDYCFEQLDNQFQNDKAKLFFEDCYENLKGKHIVNTAIINYHSTTIFGDNPTSSYEVGYEYEYEDTWVYYSFNLLEKDGQFTVYGFHFSPFENSLRQVHQFTLNDKGMLHYFFFFYGHCNSIVHFNFYWFQY